MLCFEQSYIITKLGCCGWRFCLAWFGHLSWLVHSSSVATLIQTSTPIWALQQLFIWLYSINNTPYAHTPAHIFIKPCLIVITMRERYKGLRQKNLLLFLCAFSFKCMHFEFSENCFNSFRWSIALPFWVWMMAPFQSDLSVHWSNIVGSIRIKPIFYCVCVF